MRNFNWLSPLYLSVGLFTKTCFRRPGKGRRFSRTSLPTPIETLQDRTLLTIAFHFIYPGPVGSGIGFEDATEGQARRDALESIAAEYASLFDSFDGESATIDVEVRSEDDGEDNLAKAYYYAFTGLDPGFYYTIPQVEALTGFDTNESADDAVLIVDWGYSWELDDDFQPGEFDFYQTIFHELSHIMGFGSAVLQDGSSEANGAELGDPGQWLPFDKFLTDSTGTSLIDPETFILDSSWTTHSIGGTAPDNGLLFNGYNAISANGGDPVGLYSPTTWNQGSSGSHLDTDYAPFAPLVMSHAALPGLNQRTFDPIEIGIFTDLGYKMVDAVNLAPVASPDSGIGFETDEETPFIIGDLLQNDFDPTPRETETLRISDVDTSATKGSVNIIGTGIQTHFSSTGPFTVPTVGTETFTIEITGVDGKIRDINLNLNIEHDVIGELAMTLISPNGTRVELTTSQGGFEDNFTGTTFDDEGLINVDGPATSWAALAPYTGHFQPVGSLSDFDGEFANGTWQLEIVDVYSSNATTLLDWSIDIIAQHIEYDPNGGFEDLDDGQQGFDTFTYTVTDKNGNDSTSTATIAINGIADVATLPFVRDFESLGTDGLLFSDPGTTSIIEANGTNQLKLSNVGLTGLSTALVGLAGPPPGSFEIATELTSISGPNRWLDGFIIFDYHSDNDFKYAGMFTGQNQWVIGHYEGNWGNRIAEVDLDNVNSDIDSNAKYILHLSIDNDDVVLSVNGIPTLSGTFGSGIGNGSAGVGSYHAETWFDRIEMASTVSFGTPLSFPYMEDFSDGHANDFNFNNTAYVSIIDDGGDQKLQLNTSSTTDLAVGFVPITGLPTSIDVSATLKSINAGIGWQDGFIIFDYNNENDFKFAGMFTGQNQWVIGHYEGNWSNRLAEVDWDDFGRKINPGQSYELTVNIDGSTATLFVDGERIDSATFATTINERPVGLAAERATTWFDDFEVTTAPEMLDSIYEDFNDQILDDLTSPTPSQWSFYNHGGGNYALLGDSNAANNMALQLTDANARLSSNYVIEAPMLFQSASGAWQDGFLIFDYKNANDFKYAGTFAGQNQWVIGHYQGNWGNRYAEIDWDNEGKSVNPNIYYFVKLEVVGQDLTLSVNREELITISLPMDVSGGQVGFGAYNANTLFDFYRYTDFS
ncbi:MAG: proprotein convertase P-domain-containing protein [Planctomycetaceae bacterium]|nr:proprotein convertase P-domain-containing protein [Planctomycetaceae bacterium]